ncbi:hypothetical protein JTB14_038458, partial [Gonioctena quinquepunctata]
YTRLSNHQKTSPTENLLRIPETPQENIHQTESQLGQTDTQLLKIYLTLSNIIHPTLWKKVDIAAEFLTENDCNTTIKKQFD